MAHSLTQLWIHVIFSTKDRVPLIDPAIEKKVYQHLTSQLLELGCTVRRINGISDHVHILFRLNPVKSLADVVKQIKGATSHFINDKNLISQKFSWQTGYGAFSVSESNVNRVDLYYGTFWQGTSPPAPSPWERGSHSGVFLPLSLGAMIRTFFDQL